jgi:thioredoxin-like negative regulator of GroEL
MLTSANAETFDLRLDRLADSFKLLQETDRASVDEVVGLIKMGDHSGALARLQELNQRNPQNSSLRVLTAYTMLQLGNLVGAFDEASKGEATPGKSSYKCWVLAKIALLTGDTAVCKRELKHVVKGGDMPEEARSLEADLKKKKS